MRNEEKARKSARDNHANQLNPGTKAWKAAMDNRANQLNPNNRKTKGGK